MDRKGIISAPEIARQTLDNGITLLVRQNRSTPSISLRGVIRAGAMFESDDKAGLAEFAAGTLDRGTSRRSHQEINRVLDGLGATFGVGASDESAGFYGRCLTEDVDLLLDVAADVILRPTYPRSEVEKVRSEILTGLREARNDTQWVADYEFYRTVYPPGHPYHRPTEGTEETVALLRRADLVAFHRAHFRPDATIIAIVGDIAPAEAAEKINAVFGGWRARGVAQPFYIADVRGTTAPQRKNVHVPGKTQADIALGFPGLARTNPDYHAANVANMILGVLGMYGRLGDSVREKQGLAYYVYSQVRAGIGAGPWMVRAGVSPANVERTIAGIEAELHRLRQEPVRGDELSEAQDYLTGSLALRLETNDGVAGTLLGMEQYNLGLDYLERYDGIIRSLTVDHLQAAAQTYIDPDRTVVIVAGPV